MAPRSSGRRGPALRARVRRIDPHRLDPRRWTTTDRLVALAVVAVLLAPTFAVVEALTHGQDVRLVGFGRFVAVDRKAGVARNPQPGEAVARPASRTARFRPGEGLKSALNG